MPYLYRFIYCSIYYHLICYTGNEVVGKQDEIGRIDEWNYVIQFMNIINKVYYELITYPSGQPPCIRWLQPFIHRLFPTKIKTAIIKHQIETKGSTMFTSTPMKLRTTHVNMYHGGIHAQTICNWCYCCNSSAHKNHRKIAKLGMYSRLIPIVSNCIATIKFQRYYRYR